MIYCFSATGNSAFVARKIADKLGEQVVDVFSCIKDGVRFEPKEGERLVFVTPTHCWRVPHIVEDWIKAGKLNAQTVYFVMTCGDDNGNAVKYCRALCDETGLKFMGTAEVVMPENYIAMFDAPAESEAREIIARALPRVDEIAERIAAGERLEEKKIVLMDKIKSGVTNVVFYKHFVNAKKFTVSDACISCGKCVGDCPTHCVELIDGKPVWGEGCVHCMKCICYCPVGAIEYGTKSVGQPRYKCPNI